MTDQPAGSISGSAPDSGASLIEFALLAPLIFSLLLGMISGGASLSRKNSMTNAVREGARLGATLQEDANWADAVQQKVVAIAGGDLQTTQVCVELVKKDTVSTETVRRASTCSLPAGAKPSSASVPVGQCATVVWAQRSSRLEVIFFSRDLTLTAGAVNQYERSGDPATCSA